MGQNVSFKVCSFLVKKKWNICKILLAISSNYNISTLWDKGKSFGQFILNLLNLKNNHLANFLE